ncbi:beta-casein [Rhynchocyon petersi]
MSLNEVYKKAQKQIDHHSAPPSLLVFHLGKRDFIAMKILIFACLVALALARESVEISEDSIERINEQNIAKALHEEQQREDECQDKINIDSKPTPLVYSPSEPILCIFFPQSISPLCQSAVGLPIVIPEVKEFAESKEAIFPKPERMPFLETPVMPVFDPLKRTHLKNVHFAQSQLPNLTPPLPQPFPNIPWFPYLSLSSQQLKAQLPEHVVPYLVNDVPTPNFPMYEAPQLHPFHESHPWAVPFASAYKPVEV